MYPIFADWLDEVQGRGLSALLGAYLFVGFYLGVVPPIRRIVEGLRAVADGDLTREVSVPTRDELSFVVRTLNDTVAKTKVSPSEMSEPMPGIFTDTRPVARVITKSATYPHCSGACGRTRSDARTQT